MKTHTEAIKEEIEKTRNKLEEVNLQKLGMEEFMKINRYVHILIKEAQLKEAERHDRIMKKIKEEFDKVFSNENTVSSRQEARRLTFEIINKIDQEEE